MITLDEKRRRVIEAVALLAAEPADQLSAFPEWVARVDEIALTAGDCFVFAGELHEHGRLTDEQCELLELIHRRLDAMSGHANASLWTEQALAANAKWRWIRLQARKLLDLLEVPHRGPRLDWVTFVRG